MLNDASRRRKTYPFLRPQHIDVPLVATSGAYGFIASGTTNLFQRSVLSFTPRFTVTDDTVNRLTSVELATVVSASTCTVATVDQYGRVTSGSTVSMTPGNYAFVKVDQYGQVISGSTTIPTTLFPAGSTVSVVSGGTGKTSWTQYSIPVATSTTAIGEISTGSVGQILTSNGSGSAPSMQNVVTSNTGSAELSPSSYNVTTTFANVGLTAALPSAGTWRVVAEIRAQLQVTVSTGNITVRFHNGTSAITNTERISPYSASSVIAGATIPITADITVTAATNINVQAMVPAGPIYASATIVSDGSGRSMIFWMKIR